MKTYPDKCADINTVGSFCDCIAGNGSIDPAATGFCNRVKTGENVTGDELAELKNALLDLEDKEDPCCDC